MLRLGLPERHVVEGDGDILLDDEEAEPLPFVGSMTMQDGVGAVLALWAVAALAIVGGRGLLKVIPLTWITRIAAGMMLVLAGISVAAAVS